MKLTSFDAIVSALDAARVRYLVAGGLAVNAHGYLRFTKDVDVVIQLVPDNINRAFSALAGLEYRPTIPITATQFADATQRTTWVRDKGMQVLQFWSERHRETPIDIFVSVPFDFDAEYALALVKPFASIAVRFLSIPTLIQLKLTAGRLQDRIDVEYLQKRLKDND